MDINEITKSKTINERGNELFKVTIPMDQLLKLVREEYYCPSGADLIIVDECGKEHEFQEGSEVTLQWVHITKKAPTS